MFTGKPILSEVRVVITLSLSVAGYLTSTNKSRKSTFMRSLIFKIYLQNILPGFKTRHACTETQSRRLRSYFIGGLGREWHRQAYYIRAVFKNCHVKAKSGTCSLHMNDMPGRKENIIVSRVCNLHSH